MLVLANEMFNSPPVFLFSLHKAARSAEANMPHDARVRHTAARSAEDNVPPDARGGGWEEQQQPRLVVAACGS
jgi:hypothetical protein